MQDLLQDLNHENSHVRLEAMRRVRRLSSEQRVELFREEERLYSRVRGERISLDIPGIMAMLTIAVATLAVIGGVFCPPLALTLLVPLYVLYVRSIKTRNIHARARQCLAYLLAESYDTELTVYALDLYLQTQTPETKRELRVALRNRLPHLECEQFNEWTGIQKQDLLKLILLPCDDWDLMLCALKALANVGDHTALSDIRRLSSIMPSESLPKGNIHRVRFQGENITEREAEIMLQQVWRAAQEALERIEARIAERTLEQTLLRPSHPDTLGTSETLLRAATGGEQTAPEQLLRPGKF